MSTDKVGGNSSLPSVLIKTKPEEFQSYLEDTSNLKGSAHTLYAPSDSREVSSLLEELCAQKTHCTVSAGRTGTTGGCVPFDGVALSLENLTGIGPVDTARGLVRVQAGVTLAALEERLRQQNYTLRAAPTESLAYIGGAIATGASGVRGFGYGSIRNYVSALDVVLSDGTPFAVRRGEVRAVKRTFAFTREGRVFSFSLPSYACPPVKTQAGYYVRDDMDLIDLFIGSEGTLGIIVGAELAVSVVPHAMFDGLIFFEDKLKALSFVRSIQERKRKGAPCPVALEFFDSFSLEFLRPDYSFIPSQARAALYFEQEVGEADNLEESLATWANRIEDAGALFDSCIIAETQKERERLFLFRHRLPQRINEFLRSTHQRKAATDIAVPDHLFLSMYTFYQEIARSSGIEYVNFGHIGQSHLHFNFLPRNQEQSIHAQELLRTLCAKAVAFGGTVSAEHGIGKIKKPYLSLMYDQKEIKEMAALKRYFDPACILGLDNIFDKELLIEAE
ncbi:MAG: FAD-binding oxidoreductase [Candidatus Omnitrophota bacterium]|nr:FAD-binding oxidoreductase [Candidatus Omnitrophota bacterium]